MATTSHIILNGNLVAGHEAKISPQNRGMMYGDGCFETLRSYAGQFLRWEEHMSRLEAGMDYLGMELPFELKQLRKQIQELLIKNELSDHHAMIRLQCWRKGGRGYSPDSRQAGWMVQASEAASSYPPITLMTAQTRCIPAIALERKYKLSNGLNYVKAAQEARQVQADDALMLTTRDTLSETTRANIFWVKNSTVYTPDTSCDLLPGVTRQAVLDILEQSGIPSETGVYRLMELQDAEAMFCTNSLVEICEVQSLDQISFTLKHPVVEEIKAGFARLKEEELIL